MILALSYLCCNHTAMQFSYFYECNVGYVWRWTTISHALGGQKVPRRPLDGCRGYVITDDFADYNVLDEQEGASARTVGYMHDTSSLMCKKVQPKGKTGRADIADKKALWHRARSEG